VYYSSKEYNLKDVQVPLLSIANWGSIGLHLRGNIQGWVHAGSKLKYLRFISGRHDLPFFYDEQVDVQRSFLAAFLVAMMFLVAMIAMGGLMVAPQESISFCERVMLAITMLKARKSTLIVWRTSGLSHEHNTRHTISPQI
jgi:hypothetical protein